MSVGKELVKQRMDHYGHPFEDFKRIVDLQAQVACCPDELARHVLNMICVKMSRICNSPDHKDSWDDIEGYVNTFRAIQERRRLLTEHFPDGEVCPLP